MASEEIRKRNQKSNGLEMGDIQKKENSNGDITHELLDYEPSGWFEITMSKLGSSTDDFIKKNSSAMKTISLFVLNGLVFGFFFACLYYWMNINKEPLELCYGFGSLIAFLTIIYFFLIYFLVVKRFFGKWFKRTIWTKIEKVSSYLWKISLFKWCFCLALLVAIAFFLYWDTRGAPQRLISLLGLCFLLILGFVFSLHPGRINWRCVCVGLLVQFIFGVIFIRWDTGRSALRCFSDKVATFLSYGVEGSAFVFGDLLVRNEQVFAFTNLPVIFFFSMLVEVLFFWGALHWFCLKIGRLLQSATNTTVCESMIAVGNVFLGNTESLLLIKPYMSVLTASELHVLMSSGFATVSALAIILRNGFASMASIFDVINSGQYTDYSLWPPNNFPTIQQQIIGGFSLLLLTLIGTMLAAYIGFGAEPAHLVTASVLSAPAALCYSKLLYPETKRSLTTVDNIPPVERQDQSALSAATRGATNGISLILNIIANLIAFVAFIAFINGFLGYCGGLLGFPDINLEWILGKIFIPLSWLMGVPWEECELVGSLIGIKTVVNEFVAYQRMGEMKKEGLLSARAELIATYSLCGFTNPSSAGIMIGAMASMAPNQRETLSSLALRSFFSGCAICFMTACIAGVLIPEESFGNTI